MNKPTRGEINQMDREALNTLLNDCLIPILSEMRLGDRRRNFAVNLGDANDAKQALQKFGFRFKFAELDTGCAAAFDNILSMEQVPYQATGEESEAAATARAAAITIVELTNLLDQ